MRVGVDIGGTFTDVVAYDEESGDVLLAKLLSTPDALEAGVREGVVRAAGDVSRVEAVIHGSTVVINSIIERRGARTALITTKGFRDVYEIGRINRPDSFNPRFRRHRPLVSRDMIFEIDERVLVDGEIRAPFDEDEARGLAELLKAEGVEAVGIIFLHSYKFPEHEQRMAEILSEVDPSIFVTCSHELSREYREYERTSTTAANAFVGTKVSRYLNDLEVGLRDDGFDGELLIMQSNGGLSDVERARRQCIQMMESGPAGGVVGTMALCELLGIDEAVSFDMGGTTAKSSVVVRGEPSFSPDYFVGGYNEGLVMRIPVLEIVEVGTGGGSVAWVDPDSGALHVGPRSAGSKPGPACYGLGGQEPTITDANVVLGRLDPVNFLGGEMPLDRDAAVAVLTDKLTEPLDVELERAASGMLEVATAAMADAVRGVTLQRGLDPRDFTLFAMGGGGPLHASSVARQLAIRKVVVPVSPGHFSAVGMLMTDLKRDLVQTVFKRVDGVTRTELEEIFTAMERDGREELRSEDVQAGEVSYERAADVRYVGQEHTVTIRIPDLLPDGDDVTRAEIKRRYDEAHELHYGHNAEAQPAEIVTLRVQARARLTKPAPTRIAAGAATPPPAATRGQRDVFFPGHGAVATPIYMREALLAGNQISGPAVIEETASTTVLEPGDELVVNEYGHLMIGVGEAA